MRLAALVLTGALVIVTGVYVWITHGLLDSARKDRVERLERERSEQARLVGGYIDDVSATGSGIRTIQMTVVNASPLPVRKVAGTLRDGSGPIKKFPETPVLVEGDRYVMSITFAFNIAGPFTLELDFDDDNGQRWRKYESDEVPLRRIQRPGTADA